MNLPVWPVIRPLSKITPTLYNIGLACPSRALWTKYGNRVVFPTGPAAILGQAFHTVLESASRNKFGGDINARTASAKKVFADSVQTGYDRSHPLVRWRWPTPNHLPRYALMQAEAALSALKFSESNSATTFSYRYISERTMASTDGLIEGRIDLIDLKSNEVIDYKSGFGLTSKKQITDQEARQLRLYAYLCIEQGIKIDRGVIVRRDGTRHILTMTDSTVYAEANSARDFLTTLAMDISLAASISDLAKPSEANCIFCPCRAICEPFWEVASPEWATTTGLCIEGFIIDIKENETHLGSTIQLNLDITGGTTNIGIRPTTVVPRILIDADGSSLPLPGQMIRIVDLAPDDGSEVLRINRNRITTFWSPNNTVSAI
jgi:RecB family exonuclease